MGGYYPLLTNQSTSTPTFSNNINNKYKYKYNNKYRGGGVCIINSNNKYRKVVKNYNTPISLNCGIIYQSPQIPSGREVVVEKCHTCALIYIRE